jgi:rRNA-processing protein FCF1
VHFVHLKVSQILSSPQYYVVDTNTIFDLHYGDLLEFVFRLPCKFIITDFIIHELREPPFHRLSTMGLLVESLDSEGIIEITELMEEYEKPSYEDISVLVLAKSRKTILITGDADLRHAAISKGVDCFGTCWLINYLADQSIVTYSQAIAAYDRIRKNRRNPPADECRNFLSQWKQRRKMLE